MITDLFKLNVEEKRKLLARKLLEKKRAEQEKRKRGAESYASQTFDLFMFGSDRGLSEVMRFNEWSEAVNRDKKYTFAVPRQEAQFPESDIVRTDDGSVLRVVNLSSYNYLGLGYHPDVVQAAKDALDRFGLGCASSPVASGTISLHKDLERGLVDFLGIEGYGASLFSAGYNVNTGAISAIIKPGGHIVLDQSMHMSIVEGAQLSGAKVHTFAHNDPADLKRVIRSEVDPNGRFLVCVEGVYSADGDFGRIGDIAEVTKAHGGLLLVDEAHSILLTGPRGRGVAAAQGALEAVDLFVITFSKAFGGIGGALLAKREITEYVNWYAKSRMFSCAIDPAVTAGVLKALQIAASEEGDRRRERLNENGRYLREKLQGKVELGDSESWVVPVIYGPESRTMDVSDFVQRAGLDTSVMQFPAVPKNASRMRLFVTSEHKKEQLDRAVDILLQAAEKFDFKRALR